MKIVKILIIASLLILLANTNSFAQCYFIDPPEDDPVLYDCASSNGWILPASGTIRILFVFAEINYDVHPGYDPNSTTNQEWPIHSIPSWADDLCDPNVPIGTAQGLLTRYFQQGSSENYLVLGDYLLSPENYGLFQVLESEIISHSFHTALCNKINAVMNNIVTANNLNSVSYFDNWTTTGSYQAKITPSIDNPPKIDHVMVIWRNRIGFDKVGQGYPTSYGSVVGFQTNSWTETGSFNTIPLNCVRHEYAHFIIGGNNFHTYKDEQGYWVPYEGAWGALSLYDASLLCWTGWDKQRLGWNAPGNQYNPAARNSTNTLEVNGDLDATQISQEGIYWLRDFVASGDALRIKLPHLTAGNDYEQWLWIENHNGYEENDNVFDKFQFEGNNCVQPCIPGLYMYMQIDKDTREGTSVQVGSGYRDYLRPVTAEGFYDRLFDAAVQNQCINDAYYEPFIIEPELENALTGIGDQGTTPLDKNNDNEIDVSEGNANFIQKDGNNYIYELFELGHSRHAFTATGNNKIGIGTNPSSATMMNLRSFNAPAQNDPKNDRKIFLNGVSVEILNQDSSGNIQVRVRFDDVDVVEDRRWCADSIVLSTPPFENDYSLNIADSAMVTLDWSKTATRIDNPRFFKGDTIFSDPTMFVCLPESVLHIDTNSTMELVNISSLQLLDDAILQIETGAELRIKEGANFIARSGSEILIRGTGKITVDLGAYICIEDGASVTLQDANSSIVLNDGFLEGTNPYIDVLPTTECSEICELLPSGNGSVIHNPDFPNDVVINSTTTWDNVNYSFGSDLIIESSGILTIQNESLLKFGENGKIIIEEGGKLVQNNSTITSLENCFGDTWQGIEVWGNPSLSQIPANQGWLVVTNGGTIENAEVAVRAGSADYTGKGGGIISAEDAVFLNNTVSAMFDPYTAYTNTSAFGSCTFNYTKTITSGFKFYFAWLDNVISVHFTNCTFTNNSDQDYVGAGIKGINSTFSVEGLCTNYSGTECTEWEPGLFQNLEYGVYATASTTTRFADIRHTTFTDNFHGIYLGGMTLPRVTSNEFHLNTTAAQGGYGLYLDGSTQYLVEDNSFNGNNSNLPTGIGIYVNASGSLANEIYLNNFDYIENAVTVLGYNRNSRTTTTGLQIRCNNYDHTKFDETIVHEGPFIPGSDGIASNQGSNSTNVEDMAGNLFYYETTATDYDDLYNQSNLFNYYYSSNAGFLYVEPLDITTNTVYKWGKSTIDEWTYEEGCPSGLSSGGGGETEGLRSSLAEAQSNIESTEAVLAALIDGGDTEALNTEVESSTPSETGEVYEELMNQSPYLSETVVETAIEKEEVLPNSMVRDLMVANPHTAQSLQLLSKLDDRFDPMPAYMKAQILAGRSIQSLKSELEGQLAGYRMNKAKAMNKIARYFGETSGDQAASDSLLALYQNDSDLNSRYMLAWLHLQHAEYQQGIAVINAIPSAVSLTEDEEAEYQDMQTLYGMMKDLAEAGNTIQSLDQSQVSRLQDMVNGENDLATVYARNILLALDEMQYNEPVILPDNFKTSEAIDAYNDLLNSRAPKKLEVFPNPGKDFVVLAYQLDKESKGMIEIRDISGKPVQSIPFNGMQDQVTVVTTSWNPGIYTISLTAGGETVETVKFTLVR